MLFYEFFAGGGMARLGLGADARCLFANDIDPDKCAAYIRNFGGAELHEADIRSLSTADLPGHADVAWASSPCQDLSAAGHGAGLKGPRSCMAFAFLWLMAGLAAERRGPPIIVIENVDRLVTSKGGRDLASLVELLTAIDYRVGTLVVDAALFLPQSRRRLFLVAVRDDVAVPGFVLSSAAKSCWHPAALEHALTHPSAQARRQWVWWTLPQPAPRTNTLADMIEPEPKGVRWDSEEETIRLLAMMSEASREKLAAARMRGTPILGAMSQRTRYRNEAKIQRVEVRFDGLAGCLLAPKGGSSCQRLLFIDGSDVRSRRLSPREAARLMGLPEHYVLPRGFWDAMRLIGDGVAVPVVEHLTRHLIMPILGTSARPSELTPLAQAA
ncbi:MAG TPA: DNA cytosine methyltransferase [Stellaceae bacterium]|nr:DNA cytosine methyltransferase [Stellaceae bacterium]